MQASLCAYFVRRFSAPPRNSRNRNKTCFTLREFLRSNEQGIEGISAIGTVFQQIFLIMAHRIAQVHIIHLPSVALRLAESNAAMMIFSYDSAVRDGWPMFFFADYCAYQIIVVDLQKKIQEHENGNG